MNIPKKTYIPDKHSYNYVVYWNEKRKKLTVFRLHTSSNDNFHFVIKFTISYYTLLHSDHAKLYVRLSVCLYTSHKSFWLYKKKTTIFVADLGSLEFEGTQPASTCCPWSSLMLRLFTSKFHTYLLKTKKLCCWYFSFDGI